jgi:hypothetical protein
MTASPDHRIPTIPGTDNFRNSGDSIPNSFLCIFLEMSNLCHRNLLLTLASEVGSMPNATSAMKYTFPGIVITIKRRQWDLPGATLLNRD